MATVTAYMEADLRHVPLPEVSEVQTPPGRVLAPQEPKRYPQPGSTRPAVGQYRTARRARVAR
eukprot:2967122-Rhodomonas_salina.1